jgi:hypothetical protein
LFQQPPVVLDVPEALPDRHGNRFVVVEEETAGADVTVGMVGTNGTIPTVGDTVIVGTAAAELIPRLPISVDPNGTPVRGEPPGVVGDVNVGVEDETMLLEPDPHIPDRPEVSSIPDVVDIPEELDIADVAAVAGVAVPTAIPPPSKLVVDPNIDDGGVPTVEHVVPLLGIEIVPVTPVGAGLIPGDAISVDPRGMPVGETVEPIPMLSGEVAPMVGVGLAIPLTWAMAVLQTTSAGMTAATSENRIGVLRLPAALRPRAPRSISFATISLGARLSDIGHPSVWVHQASE